MFFHTTSFSSLCLAMLLQDWITDRRIESGEWRWRQRPDQWRVAGGTFSEQSKWLSQDLLFDRRKDWICTWPWSWSFQNNKNWNREEILRPLQTRGNLRSLVWNLLSWCPQILGICSPIQGKCPHHWKCACTNPKDKEISAVVSRKLLDSCSPSWENAVFRLCD